jgi:hypothetical protein
MVIVLSAMWRRAFLISGLLDRSNSAYSFHFETGDGVDFGWNGAA